MPQRLRFEIKQTAARRALFCRAKRAEKPLQSGNAANNGVSFRSRRFAAPLCEKRVNSCNNFIARSKATPLEKRTQFAANLRLLGKGVNVRDFYNT